MYASVGWDLDRHRTSQDCTSGAVDFAHAAVTGLLRDAVVRKGLADHEESIPQPDRQRDGSTGASRSGAIVAHTVDDSQQG